MREKSIFSRKFYELTGCIHNHSEYSFDSDIPLIKIINSAQKNHLDFITINDHMTLEAKYDKVVQKEKKLHVIVGVEINDPSKNNHLLVFNTDNIISGESAEKYSQTYLEQNCITFIAHPFEKRKTNQFRKYIWTNEKNHNFTGIEIWNAVSEWLGKLNPRLKWFFSCFFPIFLYCKTISKKHFIIGIH